MHINWNMNVQKQDHTMHILSIRCDKSMDRLKGLINSAILFKLIISHSK